MSENKQKFGIIFDLDNCLYKDPEDMGQCWLDAFWQTARLYNLPLTQTECQKETMDGFLQYGNAVIHFSKKYGVPASKFQDNLIGRMDEKKIDPCPLTREVLRHQSHIPMAILSSSSRTWALRVLHHLGLDDLFTSDRVLAFEDTNGELKSQSEYPFHLAAARLGIDPAHLVMVDDHERNLVIPQRLGMCPVHVTHGNTSAQHDHIALQADHARHVFALIRDGKILWDPNYAPKKHTVHGSHLAPVTPFSLG